MFIDVPKDVQSDLSKLLLELRRRAVTVRLADRYYEGLCPFPEAVIRAKMTRAYRMLMPMAEAPWGSLVVDSVQDRLEVAGIQTDDDQVSKRLWAAWQDNKMDAESKLAHNSALLHGRAFATVWPNPETGQPEISLDNAEQMVVMYEEGSRRARRAALRFWVDSNDRAHATIYRADGIYKFHESLEQQAESSPGSDINFYANNSWWEPRLVDLDPATDEPIWPMPNDYAVVPVVEIAVNRRLKPGPFPYARGEFEHCIGLIDRINLLTFLGMIVALWMGFPLRGVIGEQIVYEALKDDQGDPIMDPATGKPSEQAVAPFDVQADSMFQLENKDAKLVEFQAADRKNLSVFAELDQLAVITKTPRHYFPLEQGMSNISADAIRASEGGLHAKCTGHKASIGESWEEVLRLVGLMNPDGAIDMPAGAELQWKDSESRSLAERADAASKLKDVLPWQALVEKVLNATQDEISRWEAMRASDALHTLIAAAAAPVVAPPGAAGTNGNLPAPAGAGA